MSRFLGVAAVQREGFAASAEKNLAQMEGFIDLIAFEYPWVDLIVFPEIAVQGLAVDLSEVAEPVPGPSTERLAQKAKEVKKWIIPGSMFEIEDDKIYNTMPVFSPDGELVTKYRKMNPFSPAEASVPGDSFQVIDIPNIGRLGLCICYDLWFPEMARTLVSMGAEVIIHPSFTPSTLKEGEILCRRAAAMFNQAYVIGTGACGFNCGFTLAGHSVIVDPEGIVLQEAGDIDAVQVEMIDLDKVTMVREVGMKGNVPMLKHLNFFAHNWPVYGNQKASSPYLNNLDSPSNVWSKLNK